MIESNYGPPKSKMREHNLPSLPSNAVCAIGGKPTGRVRVFVEMQASGIGFNSWIETGKFIYFEEAVPSEVDYVIGTGERLVIKRERDEPTNPAGDSPV